MPRYIMLYRQFRLPLGIEITIRCRSAKVIHLGDGQILPMAIPCRKGRRCGHNKITQLAYRRKPAEKQRFQPTCAAPNSGASSAI